MTDNDMHFYTVTLGCKINQYETQALREVWLSRGFVEVDSPHAAEVVLVNSCAVTAKAVGDVRSSVRKVHRANPAASIVVTGCAAQIMADELATLPGVAKVVPQDAKAGLRVWPQTVASDATGGFPDLHVRDYRRARAVVKMQDGCSHGCTYCIVPFTRGPSRSRMPHDIIDEARALLQNGFRELIISGVNLRHYGGDLALPVDFWDVVARLGTELERDWGGRARLRISSLDPGQLGQKALETLAATSMVAPQLHLSLQSGSPAVLARMGRGHYVPDVIFDFLHGLRGIWPEYGLGVDILTGFPGETAEEYAETLEVCRALPITYAHVFPYSSRPGTKAAKMKGQVPAGEKKARAAALRRVASDKKSAFLHGLLAQSRVHVVLQGLNPARGVSEFYTACCFDSVPKDLAVRGLYAVRPVAVRDGMLVVLPEQG